jgi:hypothetical protein
VIKVGVVSAVQLNVLFEQMKTIARNATTRRRKTYLPQVGSAKLGGY